MKYGIITPAAAEHEGVGEPWAMRAWRNLLAWRRFALLVVLPTALTAAYLYLIAADQYESDADFIVSSSDKPPAATGLSQLLGMGASSQAQSEVMSVADYLRSHDVVAALQSRVNLVRIFRQPEADALSRLSSDRPTPEALLKFYRSKVSIRYDHDTGITSLKVRTFRPADSFRLARELLDLGEARVNAMNERSYTDSVTFAQRQLADAESAVASIQGRMTSYRQTAQDIDPQASGQTQIKLVSEMNGNLAAARAQLAAMGAAISHSSPQYVALSRQVRSLEREVAAQSTRLTGTQSTIAGSLGGYENLRLRQQFAGKQYEAAAANLNRAREQARTQQLYVVRVVDANLPVKSLYPERGKIVLTVLVALALVYGIGWLIIAGVREHEA